MKHACVGVFMITKETISRVARNARINLNENEIKRLEKELNEILAAFEMIKKVKVGDVEPSFQPFNIKNVIREDRPERSLSVGLALKNAKQKQGNYIKGPRAV